MYLHVYYEFKQKILGKSGPYIDIYLFYDIPIYCHTSIMLIQYYIRGLKSMLCIQELRPFRYIPL